MQDEIDALRNVESNLISRDINAALLTDFDTEESAVEPPLTDSEILAEFFESENISDQDKN